MKLWKFLLLVSALAGLGVALVLGVNFLVLPAVIHGNKVINMPDIRGMSADGADLQLHRLGLQVEVSRQRAHPSIPEGMILEQIPAPAARIRGGRTVRVVTSSGPPVGAVPRLLGLSLRQAEITLQRENYRLGRVLRVRRQGVTETVVDYQNPIPGIELFKGAVVDLVVAEPAPEVLFRMPDLRGVPLYQARQTIAEAGFVLAPVVYQRTSHSVPNLVLSQTPPPGGRVRKGEHLELVASSR